MDTTRFDALTRAFARRTSRRGALRQVAAVLGMGGAMVAFGKPAAVSARTRTCGQACANPTAACPTICRQKAALCKRYVGYCRTICEREDPSERPACLNECDQEEAGCRRDDATCVRECRSSRNECRRECSDCRRECTEVFTDCVEACFGDQPCIDACAERRAPCPARCTA